VIPDPYAVAALGLAVFPLAQGGKGVLGPGWQRAATTDPDVIAATWRPGDNVGVGCWRSNVLGVDLDVKDVDGISRFAGLCAEHGDVWPETLTVRTPSGGLHLYLAVPDGVLIGSTISSNSTSRLGPGIDTRGPGRGGRGGYLVGPGSVVDGKAYLIETDLPIAACPPWLADLLALAPVPAARVDLGVDVAQVEADFEEDLARAMDDLEAKADPHAFLGRRVMEMMAERDRPTDPKVSDA